MPDKNKFIENLIDDLTEGGSIPASPKLPRVVSTIQRCKEKWIELCDDSHELIYVIISKEAFKTDLFKQKRQVLMPSNLHEIERIRVVSGAAGTSVSDVPDFHKTSYNLQYAYGGSLHAETLTAIDPNSLSISNMNVSQRFLTGVTLDYYNSVVSRFLIDDLQYKFNPSTHLLTVHGADPGGNVLAECSFVIPDEGFYNQNLFYQFCLGNCKIGFANMIGFADQKLIGGNKIDFASIKSDGKEIIKEVKDRLKEEQETAGVTGLIIMG